jgi:ubiquinone/menaquinone biosynthesis C-methylase UbiE
VPTLWEELLPLTRQLHGRVLDAGCGNGEYSRRLATEVPGVTAVVSLDATPYPVAWGQRFVDNRPRDTFVQGDIQDLAVFADGEFDCVLCWHTIEHVARPHDALRELARIARDLVMLALPIKGQGAWEGSGHVNFWSPAEFKAACQAAGLQPLGEVYVDQCGAQNWLFRPVPRQRKKKGGRE